MERQPRLSCIVGAGRNDVLLRMLGLSGRSGVTVHEWDRELHEWTVRYSFIRVLSVDGSLFGIQIDFSDSLLERKWAPPPLEGSREGVRTGRGRCSGA